MRVTGSEIRRAKRADEGARERVAKSRKSSSGIRVSRCEELRERMRVTGSEIRRSKKQR